MSLDLFNQIIILKVPWIVSEVLLDIKNNKINVVLKHKEGYLFTCPICKNHSLVYDHTKQRIWRHLDTCQLETLLHAKLPRIDCKDCGIQQIEPNWANKHSRYTILMERHILDLIENIKTINRVAEITGIGWNVILGMQKRAMKYDGTGNERNKSELAVEATRLIDKKD